MEENNNLNQNSAPIISNNTDIKSVNTVHPENNHNNKKKIKIISLIVVILIIAGLVSWYIYNKNKKPSETFYTVEQKAAQMEEVTKRTIEQGVPDKKTQLEIMKYNAQ